MEHDSDPPRPYRDEHTVEVVVSKNSAVGKVRMRLAVESGLKDDVNWRFKTRDDKLLILEEGKTDKTEPLIGS